MLIKTAAANSSIAKACGNCGVEDQLLLHSIRHRGAFRRLCTTCVLRLHPQSFCPTCFQVYPPPPPNGTVLTCFKCHSSTHAHCAAAPPSPYICPLCVNPNTPIFKLKTAEEANLENIDGLRVEGKECRVMDGDAAKKLLAAAKIVSVSMNEAAVTAKAEAERRAKEAAFTRKRAKEALEHVADLIMKEKLRKKDAAPLASGKLTVIGPGLGYANGGSTGAKANPVTMEEKMNSLNVVGLRENEKMGGISTAQYATSRVRAGDDQVLMDVDEEGRMTGNGGEIVEWSDVSDIEQMLFSDDETGVD